MSNYLYLSFRSKILDSFDRLSQAAVFPLGYIQTTSNLLTLFKLLKELGVEHVGKLNGQQLCKNIQDRFSHASLQNALATAAIRREENTFSIVHAELNPSLFNNTVFPVNFLNAFNLLLHLEEWWQEERGVVFNESGLNAISFNRDLGEIEFVASGHTPRLVGVAEFLHLRLNSKADAERMLFLLFKELATNYDEQSVLHQLSLLPVEIFDKALRNAIREGTVLTKADSTYLALDAFEWVNTPEGFGFWENVAKDYAPAPCSTCACFLSKLIDLLK